MATVVERRAVTIGTRGSALALVQTDLVRAALLSRHPGLAVAVERITTRGDAILDRSLAAAAINDKGLFIGEIEAALREGRIDLAVHSAKDLPSTLPPDMAIAAWTRRADPLDALVSRAGGLRDLPPGARVGTSSPRRACQLRALRPDLAILDIRGNVDTRLRKLANGEYDAIVLAAAGLERLGLAGMITEPFGPETMLPAAGQGALAVEVRAGDAATAALLAPLDDPATAAALRAERAFLAATEGGCAAAVAAYATVQPGGDLHLRGLIGALGGRTVRGERTGAASDAARLGAALARDLLARGGAALLGAAVPAPGAGDGKQAEPGAALPLLGRRVVVTRAEGAGEGLASRLRGLGAEPVICPTIAIVPPADTAPLDEAIGALGRFAWVAFASSNAVGSFCDRLTALGKGPGALAGTRLAAVGPGTAASLAAYGLAPEYVTEVHTAATLAAGLPVGAGDRVLIPAADIALPALAEGLRARGARPETVVAYRTVVVAPELGARVMEALRAGAIDALTFTSPSTVRGFAGMLAAAGLAFDALVGRPLVACLGPETAAAARERALPVDAVATEQTIEGLVAALVGVTR